MMLIIVAEGLIDISGSEASGSSEGRLVAEVDPENSLEPTYEPLRSHVLTVSRRPVAEQLHTDKTGTG